MTGRIFQALPGQTDTTVALIYKIPFVFTLVLSPFFSLCFFVLLLSLSLFSSLFAIYLSILVSLSFCFCLSFFFVMKKFSCVRLFWFPFER